MRITHLCMASFFPDGYSYQENMLPKFHKLQGHEVSVIASLQTFDSNGKVSYMEKASSYRNEYDIPVIRLDYKKPVKVYKKLKRFVKNEFEIGIIDDLFEGLSKRNNNLKKEYIELKMKLNSDQNSKVFTKVKSVK